jgi:hypothetical protein
MVARCLFSQSLSSPQLVALEVRIYAAALAGEEYSSVMATDPRQSFSRYINSIDGKTRFFNG